MSQLKNDRFLRALWRLPVDKTPIWIMRQAGRYLPAYRATRKKAGNFMRLCQTPEWACEVSLQPLTHFALDAAIIFSDILTIPDAAGLGLQFIEGEGPVFSRTIRQAKDIQQLGALDLNNLKYVYEAIQLVHKELNNRVPLIGFAGSPWTLAAYMVEGHSQPGFPTLLAMQQSDPQLLHQLLAWLADAVAAHLNAQVAAGAEVLMIFDTWGGLLKEKVAYDIFSLAYIKQVRAKLLWNQEVQPIPIILFTKGGARFLESMLEVGCDAIGVDWEISLQEARQRIGSQVAIQGNMHPACLLESPERIRAEVSRLLASYGKGSGHVFNLGHGITPDVPPEHVKILVDAVHELSESYHES